MISSTSLPLLVIFERHWDEVPRQLVKNLLPKLTGEGYNTFCFEAPQDLSPEGIVSACESHIQFDSNLYSEAETLLKNAGVHTNQKLSEIGFTELTHLMWLHVSSQKYRETAEKIKNLPALLLFKDILNQIQQLSINLIGVDINQKDYIAMIQHPTGTRMFYLNNNEEYRINTITDNLLKLINKQEVIFVCGVVHASHVINKLKEKNIQNILYYFPHSAKRYDNSLDEIKEYYTNETLENHTYCLLNERDHQLLAEKIIKEIKSRNINYQEGLIDGNSHTALLSKVLNVEFKALRRPEYYIDALLETHQMDHLDGIIEKLQTRGIQTHQTPLQGKTYLVISEVNTKEVAENISLLKNELPH